MKKITSAFLSILILTLSINVFGAVSDSTEHWAASFIQNADAEGWLDVKDENAFYPDNNAARQEVVYMVYASQLNRKSKIDIAQTQPYDFFDTEQLQSKYTPAIEALTGNGLIKGYPDGSFRPDGDITRAEAAAIISQLIEDSQLKTNFYGFDDEIPQWAKINIERCARAGIITGYEDNTFRANNNVTRAEIVVMLKKLNDFNLSVSNQENTNTISNETTVKATEAVTESETVTETVTESETDTETTTIYYDEEKADDLLQLINEKRREEGINSLYLEDGLNQIALLKAVEMAEKNIEDVVSPTYGTVEKMLSEANIAYSAVEQFNLGGVTRGEDAIAVIENSQEKKDRMMTPNFERAGIAYYESKWVVIYVR